MKKKSIFILCFCISAVLAVVASNRMSVDEIISENVEALSSGDNVWDIYVPWKKEEVLFTTPMNWNNNYWGHSAKNSGDMWNGLPKCAGDEHWCHHACGDCWVTTYVPLPVFLEIMHELGMI